LIETTLIPLSQLDASGLQQLTSMHCAVMQTLLADLGGPVVRRYYQLAQTDPAVICFCVLSPAGQLGGWAIGSPDPSALYSRLSRSHPIWFIAQMIRLGVAQPGVLLNLSRSILSTSEANLISPGQIELTFIGVALHAQGQGLGKTLLNAFMEQARQAGYTSIVLSVETENTAAIRLYTRAGFQIIRTFSEGTFHRHRMECSLIKTPQV
jgi:ribosomal protein S18 acetylase RimI-like enzyme